MFGTLAPTFLAVRRERRVLVRLVLAACAGTGACGKDNSESTASRDIAEAEVSDHPPSSVYLRKLGAPDGGAWTERIEGGRIIMWLGKSADEDGYVAVLRPGAPPCVFRVSAVQVNRDGTLSWCLDPVERFADGSIRVVDSTRTIYVGADVQGDAVRFTEILDDEDHVFPSRVELRRCSGKPDEEEARKTVEESIR